VALHIEFPSFGIAMALVVPTMQAWTMGTPLMVWQSGAMSSALPMPVLPLTPRIGVAAPSAYQQQRAGPIAEAPAAVSSHLPLPREALASMPVAFQAGDRDALDTDIRRILCYGDSLTAGFASGGHFFEPYGRALSEALGAAGINCNVSVCGHSGSTAKEMVASCEGMLVDVVGGQGKGLAAILKEEGPYDLVLIMSGTNDMGRNFQRDAIVEDVRSLHEMCHALEVPTVVIAPPPAPRQPPAREGERRCLAKQLHSLYCETAGVVAYVDPADLVPATDPKLWETDGLHFSPTGSRLLGQRLAALATEHLLNSSSQRTVGTTSNLGEQALSWLRHVALGVVN
jgi:lysophospholipase L1-like esterase